MMHAANSKKILLNACLKTQKLTKKRAFFDLPSKMFFEFAAFILNRGFAEREKKKKIKKKVLQFS
jgi:hypothetical protein